MSKPTTFTPEEIEVMVAIFNQIEVGKISTEKLRQDLGIQSSGTAASRLSRLREKLGNRPKGARKSAANTGDTTPPTTPKGKAAGKGKKGTARPTKKRKIEEEEDDNEERELGEGWDSCHLLRIILKHVEVGKSKLHIIQKEFNLPTLESAIKRWRRLNAKLKKLAGTPTVSESPQRSSPSKKIVGKRKRAASDDDDEAVKEEVAPRKMPVSNSRGKKLKAEGYDDAVKFEDSGHVEMDSEAGRSVDER